VELSWQKGDQSEPAGTIELRDDGMECKIPKQNGTRARLRLVG
jgi:hypothetical protein